jgi:hypothetical protein
MGPENGSEYRHTTDDRISDIPLITAELIRSAYINSCLPITTEIGYNFCFALSRKVNYIKIFEELKMLTFPESLAKDQQYVKKQDPFLYRYFEILGDFHENICYIFVFARTFKKIFIFTNVF